MSGSPATGVQDLRPPSRPRRRCGGFGDARVAPDASAHVNADVRTFPQELPVDGERRSGDGAAENHRKGDRLNPTNRFGQPKSGRLTRCQRHLTRAFPIAGASSQNFLLLPGDDDTYLPRGKTLTRLPISCSRSTSRRKATA